MITLAQAKSFLDVIHGADDEKLTLLLDGAIDEAMQYMNRTSLTEWDGDVETEDATPASVNIGVLLLLQASYQASAEDIPKLRAAAEVKLRPYRNMVGV